MFRRLVLSLLTACVVALFVACAGDPPATRTPPPTISLADLRDNWRQVEEKPYRIRGRATVTDSFEGHTTLVFTNPPDNWYGVAIFHPSVTSVIDPAIHKGHQFDVVLDGLVGGFGGTVIGQPEHGFGFVVAYVVEAKHVEK